MDEIKIKRLDRLSKIGFWLVLGTLIFPIIEFIYFQGVIFCLEYFKLIPIDCTVVGGAFTEFLRNFSDSYENLSFFSAIFLGYALSLLGLILSITIFFLSPPKSLPKHRSAKNLFYFLLITLFFVFVVINVQEGHPKARLASAAATIASFRAEAELYNDYDSSGYGPTTNDCNQPGTIFTVGNTGRIVDHLKATTILKKMSCIASKDHYRLSISLDNNGRICQRTKYMCVDNTGMFYTSDNEDVGEGLTCPTPNEI